MIVAILILVGWWIVGFASILFWVAREQDWISLRDLFNGMGYGIVGPIILVFYFMSTNQIDWDRPIWRRKRPVSASSTTGD